MKMNMDSFSEGELHFIFDRAKLLQTLLGILDPI